MRKILIIVGPTGVGKSKVAFDLARRFNGEIVNADSRQIYKELVIGASKPPTTHFAQIPHHLFDAASLDDPWDAKRFQVEADRILEEISARGRLPIVVGGTGLYVRALLYGLFEGPSADESIRGEIRKEIEEKGLPAVYEKLAAVDREIGKFIHPNDEMRIVRALEVFRLTGRPISQLQADKPFGDRRYDALKIGLVSERAQIYRQIGQRVDDMIREGLKVEVAALRNRWGPLPVLRRSIGYKEWLREEVKEKEVVEEIKKNSRNLAKRQLSWFRSEKDIVWFDAADREGIVRGVTEFRLT